MPRDVTPSGILIVGMMVVAERSSRTSSACPTKFTKGPHDGLLTKLSPVLAIINDELGDGIVQDRSPRFIDTEKLRWSDDSGALGEWSLQEVHQGLDRPNDVASKTSDGKAVEATPLTPVIAHCGGGDQVGN